MSHYYPSMVEQRHTWFWVYQAIGLAQGLGLHRTMEHSPQHKFWARIWWCCVVRDRLIALGTGRPMHINSLDCNVPMLSYSDLEEEGDDDEQLRVKAIFIDLLKLCRCTEVVLSLFTAAADHQPDQIDLCKDMLHHWVSNLDPSSRLSDECFMNTARQGADAAYKILLHLLHKSETSM